MIKSKIQIKNQLNFCEQLYTKLADDIKKSMNKYESNDIYYGLENHTRMENDIIRLRRELMELSKLIGSDYR